MAADVAKRFRLDQYQVWSIGRGLVVPGCPSGLRQRRNARPAIPGAGLHMPQRVYIGCAENSQVPEIQQGYEARLNSVEQGQSGLLVARQKQTSQSVPGRHGQSRQGQRTGDSPAGPDRSGTYPQTGQRGHGQPAGPKNLWREQIGHIKMRIVDDLRGQGEIQK